MEYDTERLQQLREAAAAAIQQFGSFNSQALAYLTECARELGLDDAAVREVMSGQAAAGTPVPETVSESATTPPPLLATDQGDSPPPLPPRRQPGPTGAVALGLPTGAQAFMEFVHGELEKGETSPERMTRLLKRDRHDFKLAAVFARHLLVDLVKQAGLFVQIPGEEEAENIASRPTDPKVQQFLEKARGYIGAEGGVTIASRKRMDQEARRLGLTDEEHATAEGILTAPPRAAQSQDEERAEEFRRDLETEFEKLSEVIPVAFGELLQEDMVHRYGVAPETGDRLLRETARKFDLKLFSRTHITGILEELCSSAIEDAGKVKPAALERIRRHGRECGLSVEECNKIIKSHVDCQRRIERWSSKRSQGLVMVTCVLPIVVLLGFGFAALKSSRNIEIANRNVLPSGAGHATSHEWWNEALAASVQDVRSQVPGLSQPLDHVERGDLQTRMSAYQDLVKFVVSCFRGEASAISGGASSAGGLTAGNYGPGQSVRNVRDDIVLVSFTQGDPDEEFLQVPEDVKRVGTAVARLLVECHAHDSNQRASNEIVEILGRLLAGEDARDARDYLLAIWASDTLLQAYGNEALTKARKDKVRIELEHAMNQKIFGVDQQEFEEQARRDLVEHLLTTLAETVRFDSRGTAASYQIVLRYAAQQVELPDLSQLKLDVICVNLPRAEKYWSAYREDLESIVATAGRDRLKQVLTTYGQVNHEATKRWLGEMLLKRVGKPTFPAVTPDELIETVETALRDL